MLERDLEMVLFWANKVRDAADEFHGVAGPAEPELIPAEAEPAAPPKRTPEDIVRDLGEAIRKIQEELPYTDKVRHLVEFVQANKRGICR